MINGVYPPETCRINSKEHWSCSFFASVCSYMIYLVIFIYTTLPGLYTLVQQRTNLCIQTTASKCIHAMHLCKTTILDCSTNTIMMLWSGTLLQKLLVSLIACVYHRDASDLSHNNDGNKQTKNKFTRGARWHKHKCSVSLSLAWTT